MFTIPVLDIQANPLDALLAAIGYRLNMLTKGDNEVFHNLLVDRQVTIQLGSDAAGVARYYSFDNGKFSQHRGKAKNPDLNINFQDASTGVKLLTEGNAVAFMSAIQNKEMTMEGDYSLLVWFSQLAKHIVPEVPEELKPYIQQAKPYVYKTQQFAKHWLGVVKHKLGK